MQFPYHFSYSNIKTTNYTKICSFYTFFKLFLLLFFLLILFCQLLFSWFQVSASVLVCYFYLVSVFMVLAFSYYLANFSFNYYEVGSLQFLFCWFQLFAAVLGGLAVSCTLLCCQFQLVVAALAVRYYLVNFN